MPGSREAHVSLVRRFSRTERVLHWANALGFLACLASGLMLYAPALSAWVGRRVLVQRIHFWLGLGWVAALVLVALAGDRRGLLASARELDTFDAEDRRWLRARRPAPAGRFNAGQKLNSAASAAVVVLFLISGLLLWFGERDTALRLASTIVLHDALMFGSLLLVIGHVYLAAIHPPTRHSMRGITLGTVREDWARAHHSRWRAPPAEDRTTPYPVARHTGRTQKVSSTEERS